MKWLRNKFNYVRDCLFSKREGVQQAPVTTPTHNSDVRNHQAILC